MTKDCKNNIQMSNMINLANETLDYVLNNRDDYEKLSCVSFDYMMGFGYLIGGWLMNNAKTKANLKLSSENQNKIFLKSKIISGDFYNLHILPRIQSHFQIVINGAEVIQSANDTYI